MAGLNPLALCLRGLGTAAWLVARAGRGFGIDLVAGDALARRRLAEALATYLWAPLGVLILLAVLAGIVAGTVADHALTLYHVELVIEPLLADTLCRNVVPILIGLYAVGRVSVDLAARLAGAGLAHEVDALEALGHDPVRYLLSPALAGVMAAVPVHMLAAAAAALGAAGLMMERSGLTDWATFLGVIDIATARALAVGMVKAWLFVGIAFAVGAAVGAMGARGPADVGARATLAFTAGLLGVFAAATLWAVLA